MLQNHPYTYFISYIVGGVSLQLKTLLSVMWIQSILRVQHLSPSCPFRSANYCYRNFRQRKSREYSSRDSEFLEPSHPFTSVNYNYRNFSHWKSKENSSKDIEDILSNHPFRPVKYFHRNSSHWKSNESSREGIEDSLPNQPFTSANYSYRNFSHWKSKRLSELQKQVWKSKEDSRKDIKDSLPDQPFTSANYCHRNFSHWKSKGYAKRCRELLEQNQPFRSINYQCRNFSHWNSKEHSSRGIEIGATKSNYSDIQVNSVSSLKHCQLLSTSKESVQRIHTSAGVLGAMVDKSRVPVLKEEDLEEKFVRGSGPGGQSVNKTASACSLKHIPTGLVVKCHEERSLHRNREKARKLMIDKLDEHYNGDMSVAAQRKRLQEAKRTKAQQKAQKKEAMKKAWREREGLD